MIASDYTTRRLASVAGDSLAYAEIYLRNMQRKLANRPQIGDQALIVRFLPDPSIVGSRGTVVRALGLSYYRIKFQDGSEKRFTTHDFRWGAFAGQ